VDSFWSVAAILGAVQRQIASADALRCSWGYRIVALARRIALVATGAPGCMCGARPNAKDHQLPSGGERQADAGTLAARRDSGSLRVKISIACRSLARRVHPRKLPLRPSAFEAGMGMP